MPPRSNDDIASVLARLDERTEHMAEDITRLAYLIDGNGEPGIKANVSTLMSERGDRKWLHKTVVGALVVSLVGWTATSIVAFNRVGDRVDRLEQRAK